MLLASGVRAERRQHRPAPTLRPLVDDVRRIVAPRLSSPFQLRLRPERFAPTRRGVSHVAREPRRWHGLVRGVLPGQGPGILRQPAARANGPPSYNGRRRSSFHEPVRAAPRRAPVGLSVDPDARAASGSRPVDPPRRGSPRRRAVDEAFALTAAVRRSSNVSRGLPPRPSRAVVRTPPKVRAFAGRKFSKGSPHRARFVG